MSHQSRGLSPCAFRTYDRNGWVDQGERKNGQKDEAIHPKDRIDAQGREAYKPVSKTASCCLAARTGGVPAALINRMMLSTISILISTIQLVDHLCQQHDFLPCYGTPDLCHGLGQSVTPCLQGVLT